MSFERHNRVLKEEFKKRYPNIQVVQELMSLTFAMRRADILKNKYDVMSLFTKYPFLQNTEQVC